MSTGCYCTAATKDEGAGDWKCLTEMVEDGGGWLRCPKCGTRWSPDEAGANMRNTHMTYEDAIILAVRAHADQTRWNEDPYIVHPLRVALRVSAAMTNRDRFTEKDIRLAKTVAVLHDVLEDSPTTFRQLKDMFGPDIVRAVELVSRSDDMTYFQFIEQLRHSGDHIAILVKLADLDDNLSDLPEERASLRKRYEQAKAALTNALEEILRD